jgi:hypothetical protein
MAGLVEEIYGEIFYKPIMTEPSLSHVLWIRAKNEDSSA